MSLLLLLVGVISWTTVLADNAWEFNGNIDDSSEKTITVGIEIIYINIKLLKFLKKLFQINFKNLLLLF